MNKKFILLNLLFLAFITRGQVQTNTNQVKDSLKNITGFNIQNADTLFIYIKTKNNHRLLYKTGYQTLEKLLSYLNDSLVHKGLIFNRIVPDSINLKHKKWHLYYHLDFSTIKRFDSIVFLSSQKVPKNIIKHFNRKYYQKKLTKANLRKLKNNFIQQTIFDIKDNPSINFKRGQNFVLLKLKKLYPNKVAGLLGFNYNTQEKRLQLNGLIDLKLYNLLNAGEKLSFKWQKTENLQELKFDLETKMIFGSDFSFKNTLYNKLLDTTFALISNEIKIQYTLNRHAIGINYFLQKIQKENNEAVKNNLAGLHYQYSSGINIELDLKTDLKHPKNFMVYSNVRNTWHLNRFLFFETNANTYINQTQKDLQFYSIIPHLFRKPVLSNQNYLNILSVLNNLGYTNEKAIFYLIADVIYQKTAKNIGGTYINTGAGLSIIKKNQNLTFEIIAPIINSYNTVNQSVYINIKQAISF